MNAVDARQAARDRAADGVAPRHMVVIRRDAWPAPTIGGRGLDPSERKRRERAREYKRRQRERAKAAS